jgi:capsular exopolysaccharide synthesis family protein
MQGPLNRYLMLARRWAWVIVLGVVVCGGVTYIISKSTSPIYQARAIFVVNADPTSSNATSSIAAAPTYAQLLTNPVILNPVVAKHKGMTLNQLNAMISVKLQTNTQLIELDIQNNDPHFATQIANEVGQSYLKYVNSQLQGTVQMLPAQVPNDPIAPKPLQDSGIGALIGLGLALTLIVIFEWVEDHISSPENAQELLAQELLVIIPQSSGQQKSIVKGSAILAEKYRMLVASLNTAQAIKPFKVVMITSALPGEGKSTVAANLASFLARTDRKVLLIDANLHNPVLYKRFGIANERGFSTVFLERWSSPSPELYGQEITAIRGLRVLPSGPALSASAELLQSSLAHQLFNHLREAPFDYVVVDAPPLLPVADAQILASLVQAVLLVVDANKTPRRALLRTKRLLDRTHARILGIALNKSPWSDYGTSQSYPNRKIQRQVQAHLLTPSAVTPSPDAMPVLPVTPILDSRSDAPGDITQSLKRRLLPVTPIPDSRSDAPDDITQSLKRPSLPRNRERDSGSASTTQQDEPPEYQEGESKASNNASKQP